MSVAVVVCCDTYEFPKSPYSRVETLPVTKISTDGVTFQGEIIQQGELPIVDFGFVWGQSDNLSILVDDKFQVRGAPDIGPFEAEVKTGFMEGNSYVVKAYVATARYVTYGAAVTFKSLGSADPVIKSFFPLQGTWGDTVTIKGKYFSTSSKNIVVKFGTLNSRIFASSDSTIICIVPDKLSERSVPIVVSVFKNQTQSLVNFELKVPVIDRFSPEEATFGDIITISGQNFGATLETNLVKFDEYQAEIVEASKTALKVRVPGRLQKKESFISVSVNNQTTNANTGFRLAPPIIRSLSLTKAFIGEYVEIRGENFSPEVSRNSVLIEDRFVAIESATKSSIRFMLPVGVYKARTFPVNVTVAQQTAASTQTITLQDPWLQKGGLPNGQPGRVGAAAFSIGGKGYLVQTARAEGNTWQYDPVQDQWEEVAWLPAGSAIEAISFLAGNKAYVCLGPKNECWAYDPGLKSWSEKAGLPDSVPIMLGFSANGQGYVLAGSNAANFWRYDPGNDRWSQLADYPAEFGEHWADTGFVAGGGLFIVTASISGSPSKVHAFNLTSGSWSQKTGPGVSLSPGATSFAVNGFGYVHGTNDLNKYNPGTNTWQTKLAGAPGWREYSIVFELNGKVYLGGSGTGDDFWEFDPAFEF